MSLKVVVLPAPFNPNIPKHSPEKCIILIVIILSTSLGDLELSYDAHYEGPRLSSIRNRWLKITRCPVVTIYLAIWILPVILRAYLVAQKSWLLLTQTSTSHKVLGTPSKLCPRAIYHEYKVDL